jgi:hypothetical protein
MLSQSGLNIPCRVANGMFHSPPGFVRLRRYCLTGLVTFEIECLLTMDLEIGYTHFTDIYQFTCTGVLTFNLPVLQSFL